MMASIIIYEITNPINHTGSLKYKLKDGYQLEVDNSSFTFRKVFENDITFNIFGEIDDIDIHLQDLYNNLIGDFNVSYNTLIYHKSLLNLELTKLDYTKYDEDFENFLLDMKTYNDVQYPLVQYPTAETVRRRYAPENIN